jgi:hypothetical protein
MSETLIVGITYIVTWIAQLGACAKCSVLNGKQWTINDLDEALLIKEFSSHPNCKCELDIQIEVDPTELQVW